MVQPTGFHRKKPHLASSASTQYDLQTRRFFCAKHVVFVQFERIFSALFRPPEKNAATRLAISAHVPSHGDEQNARHQRDHARQCVLQTRLPPGPDASPIRRGGQS